MFFSSVLMCVGVGIASPKTSRDRAFKCLPSK